TVGLTRNAEQVAEVTVGTWRGGRDNQDIAGLNELQCGMNHHVVAGGTRYGDGAAGSFGRGIDRSHVGKHQPGSPLRFVDGCDAVLAQSGDDLGVGSFDIAYNSWFHFMTFSSRSSTRIAGKTWAMLEFGSRFSWMAAINSRSWSSM